MLSGAKASRLGPTVYLTHVGIVTGVLGIWKGGYHWPPFHRFFGDSISTTLDPGISRIYTIILQLVICTSLAGLPSQCLWPPYRHFSHFFALLTFSTHPSALRRWYLSLMTYQMIQSCWRSCKSTRGAPEVQGNVLLVCSLSAFFHVILLLVVFQVYVVVYLWLNVIFWPLKRVIWGRNGGVTELTVINNEQTCLPTVGNSADHGSGSMTSLMVP
jgi:hypothetical protein